VTHSPQRAAIAGGKSTEPDDARRAADSAERRERHRRRLLRVHVYPQAAEALRCACDCGRDNIEVARDAVRRAISTMGNLDSAIVVAIGEGETAADVAATTGLTVAAVRQRACRARARLRELLAGPNLAALATGPQGARNRPPGRIAGPSWPGGRSLGA
jgi:sigma-70-like protein